MGNRAVVRGVNGSYGIYLHWHGDRYFVESCAKYCQLKGYRDPADDPSYAMARLCQVMANAIGGTLSIGITSADNDPGDHGIYTIGKDWEIVDTTSPYEEEQWSHLDWQYVEDVDEKQPEPIGRSTIRWYRDGCPSKDIEEPELTREEKAVVKFIEMQNDMTFVEKVGGYLIAMDGTTLVFIETIIRNGTFHGDTTVDDTARRRFESAAVDYLMSHKDMQSCTVRYDEAVIVMVGGDKGMLRYHNNALGLD